MVKEFTKNSDVKEVSKREEDQRIHTQNSWMENIIMLMSFMFAVVTGKLNYLCVDEGEPVDNLFASQRKKNFECSKKYEHMLEEPKDLFLTKCWKVRLKGLLR